MGSVSISGEYVLIKLFNEETGNAETGKKAAVRALQAWIYLMERP